MTGGESNQHGIGIGVQKTEKEKFGEIKQTKWNNVKQEKNHNLTHDMVIKQMML